MLNQDIGQYWFWPDGGAIDKKSGDILGQNFIVIHAIVHGLQWISTSLSYFSEIQKSQLVDGAKRNFQGTKLNRTHSLTSINVF